MTAVGASRYNFTAQYVGGSVLLGRRARQIEQREKPAAEGRAEHRAFVVGAVQQAAASIEVELNALMQHGPGHYLGSNDPDLKAREILQPNLDRIDRCIKGPLNRWAEVLRLLEKEVPPKGEWPWQDAGLLVDLRNELVHYRSNFGGTTKSPELVAALRSRKFSAAPFIPSGTDEFPLRLLCADCAEWASIVATGFLDTVSDALGLAGPLHGHRIEGADLVSVIPKRGTRWRARP